MRCTLFLYKRKQGFLTFPIRGRVGLNHLAFHATSRQQVDEIARKLRGRGVTILYADKHPFAGGNDHYAVYFEDPDWMKVELVAP
ncbi:VOC family protein [Peribacillus sp. YIM B13477]|uniref:VOC family protein n=1 Tax=Peribacillus sp. YIM B13477 TaxID=3366300 RepID=UPI00366B33C2